MQKEIEHAVKVLRQGGIIIFPTDTAFGIGCRIDDEKAVMKLFKIRKRPETKATPVLFSSVRMVEEYILGLPENVRVKLIEKYWPGALTIVLPCKIEKVTGFVRGGGETIGARIPDNQTILKIIEEVGVPIIGTSANFAGGQTPYEIEELDSDLVKQVDFVMTGECSLKSASTVIDCSVEPWKILRQGAIKIESFEQ